MPGETLPGVDANDADDEDRIVFHVDMDCFYASCERLREPALRGEPVVIGMGYEPGETVGAVATASYEAREFGVESAMPISEALDRLPRRADADEADDDDGDDDGTSSGENATEPTETGHYRSVDLEFYESVAAEVKDVLRDAADVVREVSIDEAYLDVTDRTSWGVVGGDGGPEPSAGTEPKPSAAAGPTDARTLAEGYARHVKGRIGREAGVPASVGVAPEMSTAKVASDADKPDGLVVVPPGSVEGFLAPLPTAALHGVGPVTERALADRGIETAGDVAAADRETLTAELGERGQALYRRARGEDDRAVTPRGLPKSLSRESSLPATADEVRKRETVAALAADVARRARERGCLYRTIGIKAVVPQYDVNTRARSLSGPVDDPGLVETVALELLAEFADEAVRKLGVRVSNLDFAAGDQATLTGFDAGGATEGGGDGGETAGRDGPDPVATDPIKTVGDRGKLTDWVGAGDDAEDVGDEGGAAGRADRAGPTERSEPTERARSPAIDARDDDQTSLREWE